MGKVHPTAWDHIGYEDAVRGRECWPLKIEDDACDHDKECAAAYLAGYERGLAQRARDKSNENCRRTADL